MMIKVYFSDNVIAFCTPESVPVGQWLTLDAASVIDACGGVGLTNLQRIFETSKYVVLLSENEQHMGLNFCRFKSLFSLIEAGGGVVTSPQEEVLMIYRNGRWDLPKGKLEPGETIRECALREVEEECGIKDLKLGDLIAHTYHVYELRGEWLLKCTAWFSMSHPAVGELTPQIEEGITEIRWVEQDCIANYLAQSYQTIRDVMAAAQS